MRRPATAVLAIAISAAVTTGSLAGSAALAADTSPTSPSGYSYLFADLLGEAPNGMTVTVDRRAGQKHATTIGSFAKADVAVMASVGLPITFGGYAKSALKTSLGSIEITEGLQGCGKAANGDRAGWTSAHVMSIPLTADAPASSAKSLYVTYSTVYICPDLFKLSIRKLTAAEKNLPKKKRAALQAKLTKRAQAVATKLQRTTVAHELGHAVGLGHMSKKVAGKYQVMYPIANNAPTTYASGDLAGLTALASGSTSVKLLYPPTGTYTKPGTSSRDFVISGTVGLPYQPGVFPHVVLQRATVKTSAWKTVSEMDVDATGRFSLPGSYPVGENDSYRVVAFSPATPSVVGVLTYSCPSGNCPGFSVSW
jgi:hypothetical protein